MNKGLLIIFIVLCCCLNGIAQKAVSGRVIDANTREPLSNVSVKTVKTGQVILLTISSSNGEFSLNLPDRLKDSVVLELSHVGYAKKSIELNSQHALGDIMLSVTSESLNEATASAKAIQPIRIDPEKIAYSVTSDGLAKAETVLEMLKRVPLVEVRDDRDILVNGTGTVITINNREHPLLQTNPELYLQSLPATTVTTVEVYTNPSARFNTSARINLVIKEQLKNTYSGQIMLSVNQLGTTSLRSSYGISRGKFASQLILSGTAAHMSKSESWGFRKNYLNGTIENHSYSNKQKWNIPYTGSYTASYELSKQSLFYLSLSAQGNEPLSPSGGKSDYLSQASDGTTLNHYTIDNSTESRSPTYAIKANYQYSFTSNPDRLFTFSYACSITNSNTESINKYEGIVNYPDRREDRNATTNNNEHTLQTDYVHPAKWGKLESGLKYIRRNNSSASEFYRYPVNTPVLDPLLSNQLAHKENVGIAYLSYSRTFGKYFVMLGGRMEYSDVTLEKQNAEPFSRDFFRPVPMVSITRMMGSMSRISLSYMMSSQKPAMYQLDPAVEKRTATTYFKGNPDLKSMVRHKLSAGFSSVIGKLSINTILSYTRSLDGITLYSYLTPADELFITYNNAEQGHNFGFSTYESVSLFRGMTLNVSGSLAYTYIKNSLTDSVNNGWEYGLTPSLVYMIKNKWTFRLGGGYNTGNISMQSIQKGYFSNSFSTIFSPNNHWTFAVEILNPFTPTTKMVSQTYGENYYSENTSKRNTFNILLRVAYRFWGNVQVKQNKRNIVNDDVYSGSR